MIIFLFLQVVFKREGAEMAEFLIYNIYEHEGHEVTRRREGLSDLILSNHSKLKLHMHPDRLEGRSGSRRQSRKHREICSGS